MTETERYERGRADGLAGRGPDFAMLALGASSLNAYERGYVDSGTSSPLERATAVAAEMGIHETD